MVNNFSPQVSTQHGALLKAVNSAASMLGVIRGEDTDRVRSNLKQQLDSQNDTSLDLSAMPATIHLKTDNNDDSSPYNLTYDMLLLLKDNISDYQTFSSGLVSESTSTAKFLLEVTHQIDKLVLHMEEFPRLLADIDRLKEDVDRNLYGHQIESMYNVSINMEQTLLPVKQDLRVFQNLSWAFSVSDIDKLRLAAILNDTRVGESLERLNTVKTQAQRALEMPLKAAANYLEQEMGAAYGRLTKLLARLQLYYSEEGLFDPEALARTMLVWRKPTLTPELDSLFNYMYKDSKTTWPPKRNFQSFVEVRERLPIVVFMQHGAIFAFKCT